ncbi:YtxH domain-containing protein [Armatimonas sp.]|uniref:YtxH domain-containing protein n=1 Tax=Armatimonas sp. TaxID=1872638 RepID=UPI003751CBC7
MKKPIAVVGGIVMGATVGAVAMALSAPCSGKETRDALKGRSERIRLRLSRKAKQVVQDASV